MGHKRKVSKQTKSGNVVELLDEASYSEPEVRIRKLREDKSKESLKSTIDVQNILVGAKRRKPQKSPEEIASERALAKYCEDESNVSSGERLSRNQKDYSRTQKQNKKIKTRGESIKEVPTTGKGESDAKNGKGISSKLKKNSRK